RKLASVQSLQIIPAPQSIGQIVVRKPRGERSFMGVNRVDAGIASPQPAIPAFARTIAPKTISFSRSSG
ncbi:MAG: hypothetical protein ACODAD_16315, partial [Planctomycetota bacterium]